MNNINSGKLALQRLENILPPSQLSIVYYTLVESQLRYSDVVWGSLSRAKLVALQICYALCSTFYYSIFEQKVQYLG